MNRKLIVSILAIILALTMILSVVLAALPSNAFGQTSVINVFADACAVIKAAPAIPV